MCGFDAIFREHQGTLTHILAHGVLKTTVHENSIEFQGEVTADVQGMWKMKFTLTPKDTDKQERV